VTVVPSAWTGSEPVEVTEQRPPLRAVAVRRRYWDARREERAYRIGRWTLGLGSLAAVVALTLVAREWWLVDAIVTGREQRLAEVCAASPFADGLITAAGGLAGVRADPEVVAPYLADVERLDASAAAIADHAALLGDDELAVAARTVLVARPHRAPVQTERVERRCAELVGAAGLTPGARDARP
jgi:hypothetical protein